MNYDADPLLDDPHATCPSQLWECGGCEKPICPDCAPSPAEEELCADCYWTNGDAA